MAKQIELKAPIVRQIQSREEAQWHSADSVAVGGQGTGPNPTDRGKQQVLFM